MARNANQPDLEPAKRRDTRRTETGRRLAFQDALTVAPRPITPLDVRVSWRILAAYYNAKVGYSWVGAATLASDIHANERSVRRSIDRLVSEGWFLLGRNKGRTHQLTPNWAKPNQDTPDKLPGPDADDESKTESNGEHRTMSPQPRTKSPDTPDSMPDDSLLESPVESLGAARSAPPSKDGSTRGPEPKPARPPEQIERDRIWLQLETILRRELGLERFADIAPTLAQNRDKFVDGFKSAEDPDQFRLTLVASLKGGRE